MQFAAPAEQYDRFMGRYAPTLAAALADAAGVTSGLRVLDVGCGPGGLTHELVARVGAAGVAAIDPAPQFAEACRERHPGADVRVGAAEQLPWGDGEFDAALSQLVIGFMRDPDRGVAEMRRVTRPGGTIAGCMWDIATGGMTMLRIFWSAVRSLDPDAVGERRMAGTAEGDIAERFSRAGLVEVEGGALVARAEYDGLRGLLGAVHVRGRTRRPAPRVAVRGAARSRARGVPGGASGWAVLARCPRLVRAGHRPDALRSSAAAEPARERRRERDLPPAGRAGDHAVALERVGHGAAERAAQMRPLLRPVGAAEGVEAAGAPRAREVDAARAQARLAVRPEGVVHAPAGAGLRCQPAALEERVHERDALRPGEVVVAPPRPPQRRVARDLPASPPVRPGRRTAGGEVQAGQQRLDPGGVDRVQAPPAAALGGDEVGAGERGQVRGHARLRDAQQLDELAHRGLALDQREQDAQARRVGHQAGHGRHPLDPLRIARHVRSVPRRTPHILFVRCVDVAASDPARMGAGSLNHLRLTVRDPAACAAFYDAWLALLGYARAARDDGGVAWGRRDPTAGTQWLILTPAAAEHRDVPPHDLGAPGFHHLALNAASRAQVDAVHDLLRAAGGEVLDAPAEYDYEPGYYAVFFRDPNGFKLEVVHSPVGHTAGHG